MVLLLQTVIPFPRDGKTLNRVCWKNSLTSGFSIILTLFPFILISSPISFFIVLNSKVPFKSPAQIMLYFGNQYFNLYRLLFICDICSLFFSYFEERWGEIRMIFYATLITVSLFQLSYESSPAIFYSGSFLERGNFSSFTKITDRHSSLSIVRADLQMR